MEKRDRELFARVSRINSEYGDLVLRLLTIHYDRAKFAESLRVLGEAHFSLGRELLARSEELMKWLNP